ncbi:MAG: GTP-binding protein [Candidatus Hodarchaeales archaeon]
MSSRNDILIKVCAIGSGNVGKTSLIRRYAEGKFSESYLPTLGVDITTKRVNIKGKPIKLLLADTGGQEHFARVRPTYYKGALGSLVVFALNDRRSFEAIPDWLDEFNRLATRSVALVLVGNKKDLKDERVVSTDEAKGLAEENNIPYFETSAKWGGNEINQAYEYLVTKILAVLL